jgi:hypothetical protein
MVFIHYTDWHHRYRARLATAMGPDTLQYNEVASNKFFNMKGTWDVEGLDMEKWGMYMNFHDPKDEMLFRLKYL